MKTEPVNQTVETLAYLRGLAIQRANETAREHGIAIAAIGAMDAAIQAIVKGKQNEKTTTENHGGTGPV